MREGSMTVPVVKRPAKKAAAKKPGVVRMEAEFVSFKETPGTYRLNETGDPDGHVIGGLYLKKGPLDGTVPVRVRVVVDILESK